MDEDDNWRDCVEYEVKKVVIGDEEIQVFQMEELPVAASLFMLAEMDANHSEISGKRLWTGSFVLAQYLHQHRDLVKDKKILELGAGTAICSILASKLGATRCVATDGDQEVVDIMKENIRINCNNDNISGTPSSVQCASLWWGNKDSLAHMQKRFSDFFPSQVDLILAGDVLYKQELLPLLFDTVQFVLRQSVHARFLLCHVPRADVSQEAVQQQILSCGLVFERLELQHDHQREQDNDDRERQEEIEECPVEDVSRANLYLIRRPCQEE